ncbi:hypothetical protein [Lacticaseibacillus salsurivasis]|uniref:hypothetical protein n=1 Tax=Lacticaseibacillus salsurivasis TaxID=3081441 RepID=UPI0030C6D94A
MVRYHSQDGRLFRNEQLNDLMRQTGGTPQIVRKQGRYLYLLIAAVIALIAVHLTIKTLDVVPLMFVFIFGGLYLLRDEYIIQPSGQVLELSYHDVAIIMGKQNQPPIVFIPDDD